VASEFKMRAVCEDVAEVFGLETGRAFPIRRWVPDYVFTTGNDPVPE
jgi:hypothetical protein